MQFQLYNRMYLMKHHHLTLFPHHHSLYLLLFLLLPPIGCLPPLTLSTLEEPVQLPPYQESRCRLLVFNPMRINRTKRRLSHLPSPPRYVVLTLLIAIPTLLTPHLLSVIVIYTSLKTCCYFLNFAIL